MVAHKYFWTFDLLSLKPMYKNKLLYLDIYRVGHIVRK